MLGAPHLLKYLSRHVHAAAVPGNPDLSTASRGCGSCFVADLSHCIAPKHPVVCPAGFLASQLGPLPAPAPGPALASASMTAQLARAPAPLLALSAGAPAPLPAVVPVSAPLAVLPALLGAAGALSSAGAPAPAPQQVSLCCRHHPPSCRPQLPRCTL